MTVRVIRAKQLGERLAISQSKLHRDVALGLFPKPIRLGKSSIAWRVEDVEAWVKANNPHIDAFSLWTDQPPLPPKPAPIEPTEQPPKQASISRAAECRACLYWHLDVDDDLKKGQCRIRSVASNYFPKRKPTDWCGEFAGVMAAKFNRGAADNA